MAPARSLDTDRSDRYRTRRQPGPRWRRPLDNAGSLSRAARIAAGRRAAALNRRTRAVAIDHPRLVVVPFPTELTERSWVPQSEELRYTRTYSVWSRGIVATVAVRA